MSFSFDNVTPRAHCICILYHMYVSKRYVLKRTYGMCKICNVRMPHAIGNIISGIGIGIAVVDSIGYRAPARYRSNPICVT